MTKLFSLFALFLLLLPSCQAQQNRISGRVVDAETKEPIPFTAISLAKFGAGVLADEQGYFQLANLDSLKQDSIRVMNLSYYPYAALIDHNKMQDLQIELRQIPVGMRAVCRKLTSQDREKNQNALSKDERIAGLPGTQYAFFVKNEKQKPLGKMRTVSLYIGENGFPREPFRLRIYKANDDNHAPITDLLMEEVVLFAPKATEWYTIDLSKYEVTTPSEGYFIALEFPVNGRLSLDEFISSYTPIGQIMRPSFDLKEQRVWNLASGKDWKLLPASTSLRRYSAMIKVEADIIK